MGDASARAQGLKQQITSAVRFRQTEGQTAYIMIDREGNEGKGSVLGLLKVTYIQSMKKIRTKVVHKNVSQGSKDLKVLKTSSNLSIT